MTSAPQDWKVLILRRDGACSVCGVVLPAGIKALWSSSAREVSCTSHEEFGNEITRELHNKMGRERNSLVPPELNYGKASGSAMAKYENLLKRREERLIAQFPRSGKFWSKVLNEPQNIKAWRIGAVGERAIGKKLDVFAKRYSKDHCQWHYRNPGSWSVGVL